MDQLQISKENLVFYQKQSATVPIYGEPFFEGLTGCGMPKNAGHANNFQNLTNMASLCTFPLNKRSPFVSTK